ncbi:MAG: imelysin family protein [Pedobacter sp.]|nr:imelysin family protein [Pedobacter sp.]
MNRLKFKHISLACLLALTVFACSKKKGTDQPEEGGKPGVDRKALLTYLADDIIIPSYANFKTKLDLLQGKSDAFTAAPTTASLVELRTAWVNAYVEWQKIELIDVGPASSQTLRAFFNVYPTNVANINSGIANGTVNFDLPATYAQQGFPALDYLINGLANNDTDIVTFYSTAADAAKRIAYVKKILTEMNSIFAKVYTPWTTGVYRDEFISKSGTDASSSLAGLVNGYVSNYERYIRSGKFGIPSGSMINGVVSAEKVEALYKKDISLTLAKTAQQASVDFFNGKSVKTRTEGSSFKTYLDALGANDSKTNVKLTHAIQDQLGVTLTKLNLLTENLNNEVKNNNQKMIDVYTEMQKFVRMVKVDMTSAMSITITYTDNDGD